MRVIVCGGRNYDDQGAVDRALDLLHAKRGITLIIEGGADGADRLARWWAQKRGVPYQTFEADWVTYGKRAGPWRNMAMIYEGKPDGVVAFPGGRGTADMADQAKRACLTVWWPVK